MLKKSVLAIFLITFFALFCVNATVTAEEMKHKGHNMMMHHQHMMLNHALNMSLEGAGLVMIGNMGMAKGVDKISLEHGKMMVKHGKSLWQNVMSGESMMKMHSTGANPMDDPGMKYTHKLAEAQLKVIDLLTKMPEGDNSSHGEHKMTMHHQHMVLNHALKMSVEGANMIMSGKMGMAGDIDELSLDHGKMMMKHAKTLFNEVMSGEAMMEMHKGGKSPKDDPQMKYTHKLAEATMKVMNMLAEMPAAKK